MTEKSLASREIRFSTIWMLPIIALAMGVYVILNQWLTQGPMIEIHFDAASGIEQGKTKVKYRDLDMGRVESIRLNDALDGVVATIRLLPEASSLLRQDTQFWVVTAQVGIGSITGLDTIVSGAYIKLSPGKSAAVRREFVALKQPPLTPTGAAGLRLNLSSDRAASLTVGDQVLYNGFAVGRVESMTFDTDSKKAQFVVFIDAPFHELVNTSVRFWDVSGISLTADADGIRVEAGSMYSILQGGVAFGLPPGMTHGDSVANGAQFHLYSTRAESEENPFYHGLYYVVSFSQSIKGLALGAPVEYRGFTVGRVEKILLRESIRDVADAKVRGSDSTVPVLIYIEPGRVELPDSQESLPLFDSIIRNGVPDGLRATLESANLLTGAKYISIDYFDNATHDTLGTYQQYTTIPTIGAGFGQMQQSVASILTKIDSIPFESTVENVNNTISSVQSSLSHVQSMLGDESTQSLAAGLQSTLADISETMDEYGADSELYQSLDTNLTSLARTLRNLERLTEKLARQPNSVVLPNQVVVDQIPEAGSP